MTQFAYRGYLVRETTHGWHISKNTFHIAWAQSAEQARQTIDQLI